ncbi:hypothetical protein J6590_012973 [Homalodisca vitripennis]|nr:hypothetical protein J6590_012973 [Homalodisca vitripennis]
MFVWPTSAVYGNNLPCALAYILHQNLNISPLVTVSAVIVTVHCRFRRIQLSEPRYTVHSSVLITAATHGLYANTMLSTSHHQLVESANERTFGHGSTTSRLSFRQNKSALSPE